jgi:tagatose 1,6-diphosphate aldolase GatY/KbaY
MPLVSSRELLLYAQKGGYAVAAFNVENMEMAQAVVSAAAELSAPVIVQTTSGTLKYAPPAVYAAIVNKLAGVIESPVVMHLDHGSSLELAKACIAAGYTSLMIDGSTLPFADNAALTKSVVQAANGIPVEAELGTVGGKEDDHDAKPQYTDPAEAAEFVRLTGIESFAVAIGTAHGIYKGTPHLDIELLDRIRKTVSIPLVLHGTSGVPHDQVRACIARGICKVNYATELRIAFSDGVKRMLAAKPDAFDPKQYLSAGREAVKARVLELIRLCGSDGKG